MKKNTYLYYFALAGVALAVPALMTAPDGKNKATQPSVAQAEPPPPAAAATLAPLNEELASIETPEYRALISKLNGGIKSFTLKDPQFRHDGRPIDVVTTDKPKYYPMVPRVEGLSFDDVAWKLEQLSPQAVRASATKDGVTLVRKLEAGSGPYQLWVTTKLVNNSDKPRKLRVIETTDHYVERHAESGGVPLLPARSSAISRGLCHHNNSLEHFDRSKLLEAHDFKGSIKFVGVDNVYFLKAIVAASKAGDQCRLVSSDRGRTASGDPIGSLIQAELFQPETTLAPGAQDQQRVLAYFGPKTPDELAKAGYSLIDSIESGFFSSLAHGLTTLLSLIHSGVGNWGIAIILLTFLVKLVLYPLTHKQMQSMARMKELKPEMDRINEQYADDREKKGAAIMELYRKKGVNPMAGCFPVLLQLPIWFSLYASLSSNIRLLHAPFALWWRDLSSPDPYFVLPLALGVLMFVQQKMTPPAGADPLQAKMMLYVMPVMITSFMLFLPAGLCLYMFTNSALSIVQQRFIESRLKQTVQATAISASSSSRPVAENDVLHADATQAGSKDKTAQRRLRRGRK